MHFILPLLLAALPQLSTPLQQGPPAPLWADFDGDGLLDVYVFGTPVADRLLRNRGAGEFVDATLESGLTGNHSRRALLVDLDGDGRAELVRLTWEGSLTLHAGCGDGRFGPASIAGVSELARNLQRVESLDFDADGDMDLIGGAVGGEILLIENLGGLVFESLHPILHGARATVAPLAIPSGAAKTVDPSLPELDDRVSASAPVGSSIPRDDAAPSQVRARSAVPRVGLGPSGGPGQGIAPIQASIPAVLTKADSLRDQGALPGKLRASSTPTLGMLYPLTSDLFVADSGRVGVGTTDPEVPVHVAVDDLALASQAMNSDDLVIESSDAILGLYSNSGGSFGSGIVLGEVTGGVLDNKWALVRETGGLGSLAFTFGTAAAYNINPQLFSFTPGGEFLLGDSVFDSLGIGNGKIRQRKGDLLVASSSENLNLISFKGDVTIDAFQGKLDLQSGGLVVDGVTRRVGIQTDSPEALLHVKSTGVFLPPSALSNDDVVIDSSDAILGLYSDPGGSYGSGIVLGELSGNTLVNKWSLVRRTGSNRDLELTFGTSAAYNVNPTLFTFADEGDLHIGASSSQELVLGAGSIQQEFGNLLVSAEADLQLISSSNVEVFAPVDVALSCDEDMRLFAGKDLKLSSDKDISLQFDALFIAQVSDNVGIGTRSPVFKLHVNGSAGKPGGGSWSVASDARLKRNVHDLEGSLERLLALRGVTYEYLDPDAIGELDGVCTGMIAQEVEQIFPDWVEPAEDGYLRLSIRGFEALTVEALRELREEKDSQIEALNARLEALERRLTAPTDAGLGSDDQTTRAID